MAGLGTDRSSPRSYLRRHSPAPGDRAAWRKILIALNQSSLSRDPICRLGGSLDQWLQAPASADAALSRALSVPSDALLEARAVARQAEQMASLQEAAAADLQARVVTRLDPDYPAALMELELPPPVLFVRGKLPARPGVAIVGPRNADPYGLDAARELARELARAGLLVVSGFARGVDITAHRAALDTEEGQTLAVLGCGLAARYPRQHYREAERIIRRGAVISEFPCDYGPRAQNFPIRNRLIAALSHATLVIQASVRSGSLITARCALDLGRGVLAVPGRIFDRRSMGANALLRDGAHVVVDAESVIDTLPSSVQERLHRAKSEAESFRSNERGQTPLARRVLASLDQSDHTAEQLARHLEAPVGTVLASLLELEVDGEVRRIGAAFSRRRKAVRS
jgi:DNA processing protein